jgi:peptidoglycan/xylan/chitin deacetylase (PgdA/CDA1 family)
MAVLFGVSCAGPQPRPPVQIETPPKPPLPREPVAVQPSQPSPPREPVAVQPSQPPPRPSLPPGPHVRIFPEFVALIAHPGDTFLSLAATYLDDPSLDWFISEFNGSGSLSTGQELMIPRKFRERGGLSFRGFQTVPVITYHKLSKNKADATTVRESDFEEQMRYLRENGYRVLTMDEFFDFLDFNRIIPPKSVVITIDEDWHSTYDIAFPILKKYGYPATLFLYTDIIRDKSADWNRITEMSRNGIDVQCHTKTHRNLDKRNSVESFREYFESVKKELAESAEIIRKHLMKEVKYLAYPYGDTNSLVIALLKKLGYRGAFTVKRGSNPSFIHHYQINRSMIYGWFNLQDFEKNLASFNDQPFD